MNQKGRTMGKKSKKQQPSLHDEGLLIGGKFTVPPGVSPLLAFNAAKLGVHLCSPYLPGYWATFRQADQEPKNWSFGAPAPVSETFYCDGGGLHRRQHWQYLGDNPKTRSAYEGNGYLVDATFRDDD